MDRYKLTELISADILQEIQNAFSRFAKMAALITDETGAPITTGSNFSRFCFELTRKSPLGYSRCMECDKNGAFATLCEKRTSIYKCHAGLVDFAAPIMLGDDVIGSFIAGQVRVPELVRFSDDDFRQVAAEYEQDPEEYVRAAHEIPVYSLEYIERTAQYLFELSKVLSEMAFNSYTAIQQSRQLERNARSQASVILTLSNDIHNHIDNWTNEINEALNSNNSDKMRETMEHLLIRSRELGSIVGDTIDYMNISSGKVELNEGVYSLRRVLESATADLEGFAKQKNDVLNITIDESVPEKLLGDYGKIIQVVSRLISNAIDNTENDNIHIHATCKRKAYANMLTISVGDKGLTMSPEKLESYRSYIKSRNVNSDNEDGIFGLSLVGYLVERMAGQIEMDYNEDNGVECRVVLPQLSVEEV